MVGKNSRLTGRAAEPSFWSSAVGRAPRGVLVRVLTDAEKDLIKRRQKKLEQGDPSVAEEVDFVVCAPVPSGEYPTEPTKCCKCGTSLVVSPRSPKKPPRICMDCVMKLPHGPDSRAN